LLQYVAHCFDGFFFPQDSATTRLTQETAIVSSCFEFVSNEKWPQNAPDLNSLGCNIWVAVP